MKFQKLNIAWSILVQIKNKKICENSQFFYENLKKSVIINNYQDQGGFFD